MRLRRTRMWVVACVGMLAMGCSAASDPDPSSPGGSATSTTPTSTTGGTETEVVDAATAMQECMAERGWEMIPDGRGGLEIVYPSDQRERFQEDNAACLAEQGPAATIIPMTQAEAEAYVDALIAEYECLLDADLVGITFDPPPNRQVLVEALMVETFPPPWSAILQVHRTPTPSGQQEAWWSATDVCLARWPDSYIERGGFDDWQSR